MSERVTNLQYYFIAIGLYILCVVLSCVIDDLTFIFGVIAAFTECTLSYILPGAFYTACLLMNPKLGGNLRYVKMAGCMLFSTFGIGYFCVSNYFNYLKL